MHSMDLYIICNGLFRFLPKTSFNYLNIDFEDDKIACTWISFRWYWSKHTGMEFLLHVVAATEYGKCSSD